MEIEDNNQNDNIQIQINNEVVNDNNFEDMNIEKEKGKNIFIIENDEYIEEENDKEKEGKKLLLITKYSNLEPNLFSNEFILDYKCISCGLIPSFEKANETLCCGFLICGDCLKKYIEEKKGCPICNIKELKTRDIKQENKIFYKSFKNLIIKCPYKCEWTGIWVDLEAHLNECKLGYRECKYKTIGCEYVEDNDKVKEHEQTNDNFHLNLALKFIKDKKIVKKIIKFEMGETIKTTVHPHEMTYCKSRTWVCDGRKLEAGCYSHAYSFSSEKARFRCVDCDFDLCDKCVVHYIE